MKARPSLEKRRKELQRQERQRDKALRRAERKTLKATSLDESGESNDGTVDADPALASAVAEQPADARADTDERAGSHPAPFAPQSEHQRTSGAGHIGSSTVAANEA